MSGFWASRIARSRIGTMLSWLGIGINVGQLREFGFQLQRLYTPIRLWNLYPYLLYQSFSAKMCHWGCIIWSFEWCSDHESHKPPAITVQRFESNVTFERPFVGCGYARHRRWPPNKQNSISKELEKRACHRYCGNLRYSIKQISYRDQRDWYIDCFLRSEEEKVEGRILQDLAYSNLLRLLGVVDPYRTHLIQRFTPYYLNEYYTYLVYYSSFQTIDIKFMIYLWNLS